MREMKDSGIEWIGEIPLSWELSKIGALYEERNIKVSDTDYVPLSVTKKGIVPQLETAAKTDNGDNRKLIQKNDFVINSRSDRRGSCGISDYDGSCSLINTVLKPRKNMCNAYYSFVFHSDLFADEFYAWGNGIVDDLWSTKWSSMKRIYIPAPSMEEQKKIADYLAEKCSKIDKILSKLELQISKIEEYKKSLISETITQGCTSGRDTVETKIPWIRNIPSNWKVAKLKTLMNVLPGYAFPSDDFSTDNGIPLLRGINVTPSGIRWDEVVYWDKEIDQKLETFTLKENDVVMGLDRPWINEGTRVTFIKKNDLPSLLLQRVCRIRAIGENDLRYIYYWLGSDALKQSLEIETTGVSVPHISTKQLQNFLIAVPPIEEQKGICDYLEKKCYVIDKNIHNKRTIINKLNEYKKSLIYEVVTGKKEV